MKFSLLRHRWTAAACVAYVSVVTIIWKLIAEAGGGTWEFWLWNEASWQVVIGLFAGTVLGAFAYLTWRVQKQQMLLLAQQMKLSRSTTQSAVHMTIADRTDRINQILFEHPWVYPALNESYLDPQNFSERGDPRYHIIHIILTQFENVYLQNTLGLLGEHQWNAWRRTMHNTFRRPYVQEHWQSATEEYDPEFASFVNCSLLGSEATHWETSS